MDINTDTAALGLGVETNGSISNFNRKAYTKDSNTRQLYQSSHLLFGHKKQIPKEYTGTGTGQNLGMEVQCS